MEELRKRHPREQGDAGERAAIQWIWRAGGYVFIPTGHSPDYDLVADFGTGALRVEVKTSTRLVPNSGHRFQVQLCTRGGNQSWNRVAKHFDAKRCDFVFILVADGRRWFIPTRAIANRGTIIVGGPRCAEFEVTDEDAPTDVARLLEWAPAPGGAPELESRAGL